MGMFVSLKTKIILLIISIMIITAAVTLYFTNKDISTAMLEQQNTLSKNVLYLINLNIKGSYDSLVFNKLKSITRYKHILKTRTNFVLNMIEQQNQYIKNKEISYVNAKQSIMDWIAHSGDDKLGQLFITDTNLSIVTHPDASRIGDNIGMFRDMKSKTITEIINGSQPGTKPMITVFSWIGKNGNLSKNLVCFRKYKKWNWIIGSLINIDDIETEAQQGQTEIIEILKETFADIKIAETGFAFLFDHSGKTLAITDETLAEIFVNSKNTLTGTPLIKDMMAATEDANGHLFYQSPIFKDQQMIAYVDHFKPLNWYVGVTVPVSEIKAPAKKIITRQTTVIGIVLICGILVTAGLVTRISRPLDMLSDHVKAFSSIDFIHDEQPEHDAAIKALPEKYNDEVGRLAESFIFMKTQLKENIRQLIDTTAVKERIEGELNTAKEIQLGIIPKTFPPFPDHKQIDIYAALNPAKEVGGDLYDYYFIDENKLCFTIGDVSDKGVPAALMMVITKTLIKTSASKKISPARIMMEVNKAISSDNPRTMFVTLVIGILDLDTGLITYSNGGHNPPVLIGNNGEARYIKQISGPVVGVMDDMQYKDLSLKLEPGEAFFMYTDGVTEARNMDQNFYSDQRLLERIMEIGPAESESTIHAILSDIKDFVGKAPQYDDIAMLNIKYKGNT